MYQSVKGLSAYLVPHQVFPQSRKYLKLQIRAMKEEKIATIKTKISSRNKND